MKKNSCVFTFFKVSFFFLLGLIGSAFCKFPFCLFFHFALLVRVDTLTETFMCVLHIVFFYVLLIDYYMFSHNFLLNAIFFGGEFKTFPPFYYLYFFIIGVRIQYKLL